MRIAVLCCRSFSFAMDPLDHEDEIATILDTLAREVGQGRTEHRDGSETSAIERHSE